MINRSQTLLTAKNVILFNVPKTPTDSNNSNCSSYFNKLAIDIKLIVLQQLGKFVGKIRPLKISLNVVLDVFKISCS